MLENDYQLLARGAPGTFSIEIITLFGTAQLRTHRQPSSVCFKNARSDRSHECTPNRVNVF
jgi:hypothetical protein